MQTKSHLYTSSGNLLLQPIDDLESNTIDRAENTLSSFVSQSEVVVADNSNDQHGGGNDGSQPS